jgi:hypothetical protein
MDYNAGYALCSFISCYYERIQSTSIGVGSRDAHSTSTGLREFHSTVLCYLFAWSCYTRSSHSSSGRVSLDANFTGLAHRSLTVL